ncbi:tRNA (adenosine(37)-N6)-threonylcarbamoyltransferase complex ATPase subunit type 1 TsaE [Patescibacteria group bacterium]|nr:tRNA (adenosine(37)-N6)-threonylcarbamoyltransferase complex ATPase subunit type 1 TsaE [Patescibacteria group bacterium]MCL5797812.1 tRNA (adenosine(37)-N6)-threonylcarbamoyltransferase complex ATPase subunit type 1 TsaE [Patescibacteria group bacterium]
MTIQTNSEEETRKLAAEFTTTLSGGEVVCLYGDLGAGKTVFASSVIDYFLPKQRVLSPTFIIVRHYYPQKSQIKEILHIDLYRTNHESEIKGLGLPDMLKNKDKVYIIEWADRLGGLLPKKRIDIHIETKDDKRFFEINGWKR